MVLLLPLLLILLLANAAIHHWSCLATPILMMPKVGVGSPVDCSFERNAADNNFVGGFCAWRPDTGQQGTSHHLWHTGNAVLVDSVNSVVHSSSGGDRFAFAQGRYGAPTEGLLRSPLVHDLLGEHRLLRLNYWKASVSPSLDICLEEEQTQPLRCVDSIQGPGQPQWVRRSVELPPEERPYRVVFRAKNLLAAEDIIAIDDIQLLSADGDNAFEQSPAITGQLGDHLVGNSNNNKMRAATASMAASLDAMPKNPFEDLKELAQQKGREEQQQQQQRTRIFAVSSDEEKQKKTFRGENEEGKQKEQQKQQQSTTMMTTIALVRPQIRLSPSLQMMQMDRPQSDASMLSRPMHSGGSSAFPDMPSRGPADMFSTGVAAADQAQSQQMHVGGVLERGEQCRAVSCSFMEDTCLWDLGSAWHSTSHGSVSIESPATNSRLVSAQFRPPVASYVDFDLWMSDDAELTVAQQISPDSVADNEIQLFTRRSATDGGWHRFRVPLRPSFSPVRLLFVAQLSAPVNAFISLSNIRLVNADGTELGCQAVMDGDEKVAGGQSAGKERALLADLGLDWLARQPAPLQLPPALLNQSPFPAPPPFPAAAAPNAVAAANVPLQRPEQPQQQQRDAPMLSRTAFNPLKPMLEGILPIVPLRDNPPRLTALMDEPPQHQHQQRHNQDFPQLLFPFSVQSPPNEDGNADGTNALMKRPPASAMPAEEGISKFEMEQEPGGNSKHSSSQSHQQQQQQREQFYGATPIPMVAHQQKQKAAGGGENDDEEEALLPFGAGGGGGENGSGGGDEAGGMVQQQQQPKENAEVTLFPRRRSKLPHHTGANRGNTNNNENWPELLDMGSSSQSEKKPSLPSSVSSVLASSHHRGWVERADGSGDIEFHRRRHLLNRQRQ